MDVIQSDGRVMVSILFSCEQVQRSARLSRESRDQDPKFWNHGLIFETETETFSLVVSILRLRPRLFLV